MGGQTGRVAALLLAALAFALPALWPGREGTARGIEAAPRAVVARGELAADERNNIDVFKAASSAVVHITTLERAASLFSADVLQVPRGTGSGFIWDERGHVVTNFHVVQGADAARVTLSDQSTYKAALVGAFPDRDIAVLRIGAPPGKLKPIALGQSAGLQVGQKVYAIGNPFGLDQTMTTGIVSALNREIESVTRRPIRGVIQTDAAINPGNSGGPLLDSAGRLIGINTAIYSTSGASVGIGFAIPVDEVNRIVPRLIRDGRLIRPALGIAAAPPEFNRALGLPDGVAVVDVARGGPAAEAGLQPFVRDEAGAIVTGDVITAIDGQLVHTLDRLFDHLERRQPGDVATLSVWRKGAKRELRVRLGVPD